MLSVVYGYGIPLDFPEEVYLQAGRIPEEVREKELQGRLDLRGITTITIDGEDAKDLDDAVTLSREGDVWQLGVHIADVSEYVGEGQALDREAYERGTSVKSKSMEPRRLLFSLKIPARVSIWESIGTISL